MAIEEVIDVVAGKTGLSKEEILLKISNKQNELSGLVSEEGAAYIIANELGVQTKNNIVEKAVAVSDVTNGMKSATVNGRIMGIFGPHSFKTKKGRDGKVANLEVADKTGSIRIALWNMSDIEKVEKNEIKVGDIIQVKNGYVRPGYRGGLEVNLGSRGILITDPEVNPDDFPAVGTVQTKTSQRIKIKDLADGDSYKEIRAAVAEVYGSNFVYDLCPNCNKRITGPCEKCGQVTPTKLLVLNMLVDDGTGVIRTSLFRDTAEKFMGMKTQEIESSLEKTKEKLNSYMGSEFVFSGRAKMNDFSNSLEFNAYSVNAVNPQEEAEKILNTANT